MAASSGKRPAVVQGPNYGSAFLLQVVQQQGIIEVVIVKVVQMHDVGFDFLHPCEQFFCGAHRAKPLSVKQAVLQIMDIFVGGASDLDFFAYRRPAHPPVGDESRPALRLGDFRYVLRDSSRAEDR